MPPWPAGRACRCREMAWTRAVGRRTPEVNYRGRREGSAWRCATARRRETRTPGRGPEPSTSCRRRGRCRQRESAQHRRAPRSEHGGAGHLATVAVALEVTGDGNAFCMVLAKARLLSVDPFEGLDEDV